MCSLFYCFCLFLFDLIEYCVNFWGDLIPIAIFLILNLAFFLVPILGNISGLNFGNLSGLNFGNISGLNFGNLSGLNYLSGLNFGNLSGLNFGNLSGSLFGRVRLVARMSTHFFWFLFWAICLVLNLGVCGLWCG